MNNQSVRGIVVESLSRIAKPSPELMSQLHDPDVNLPIGELDVDSLDVIEWCMEIEERTGIELDPAELTGISTVTELIGLVAGRCRRPTAAAAAMLQRAPRDRPLPLSFSQEGIWNYCQAGGNHSAYVLCAVDWIAGDLDIDVLRDCLTAIVRRHEILRTTFPVVAGRPVQAIHPAAPVELLVFDVRAKANPEQAAEVIIKMARSSISDLANGPLTRFLLIRIRDNEHQLVRIFHHLLWDRQSAKVFLGELTELYEAQQGGRPAPEIERLQYGDYAAWQRRVFDPHGSAYRELVAWWREYLRQLPCLPKPPFRRRWPRRGVDPAEGRYACPVDSQLVDRIDRLRREQGGTLYSIWLAAFVALLAMETNCPDVVVGSYTTSRRRRELQNVIGDFSNTIALRFRCDDDLSFRDWISRVRDSVAAAELHGQLPYRRLGDELRRVGVAMPPIRMIFTAVDSMPERNVAGLKFAQHPPERSSTMPWGFVASLRERDGLYKCVTSFDAGIYDPLRVRAFINRMHEVLNAISHEPDLSIGELRSLPVGAGTTAVLSPV